MQFFHPLPFPAKLSKVLTSVMATSEQMSPFQHDSLPSASDHIRLLEIIDLDETQDIPICCRLSTFAAKSAPSYCAISYTWGDPDNTVFIKVNGRRMQVRQNCEYVLKQAKWYSDSKRFHAGRHRYFWCDAICINQASSNEKSSQVAKMGEIYERAKCILCCVGKHSDGSEDVVAMLQSRSPFLKAAILSRKVSRIGHLFPGISTIASIKAFHSFQRVCRQRWTRSFDKPSPSGRSKPGPRSPFSPTPASQRRYEKMKHKPSFIDPLISFATRPYFQRAWIYQELCYGSDIILCCGSDRASLFPLRELIEFADSVTDFSRLGSLDSTYGVEIEVAKKLVEVGITKTKVSGWPEGWLARHLSRVSQLECSDDRDRVYSFVSLIPWAEGTTPIYVSIYFDAFISALATGITQIPKYPNTYVPGPLNRNCVNPYLSASYFLGP